MKTCNYIAHEKAQAATHGLFYMAEQMFRNGLSADSVEKKRVLITPVCTACRFNLGRKSPEEIMRGHLSGAINKARTDSGFVKGKWIETVQILPL